jgi:hypothetical protein
VFQELKRYLASPPVMVAPEPGEPLLLYVTATVEVVSMVLVAKRPEPPHPQETKEAAGSPGVRVTAGSELLEASPAPESQG